jgi:type I restriction enzyme S subunit
MAKLGELCEIQRGGSPRPIDQFITESADGINWIKIGDVGEGEKYILSTQQKIRPEGARRSRFVESGDFLLTNSMSFGRPYILRTSGCIHDGWLVLRYDKARLSEDYLYHALSSGTVYSQFVKMASGAVVKNLNSDVVKGVVIPLPPLAEQRRIAAILDKADGLRAKRRKALAQLDGLAQSIFKEMFRDSLRSAIRRPLLSLVEEFRYGTSNKSGEGGYPALRIPNVIGGAVNLTELKTVSVDVNELSRLKLLDGDLLFVRTNGNQNYVGRSAVFSRDAVAASGFDPDSFIYASYLIRARLKPESILPAVLQLFLSSEEGRRELRSYSKTSAGQFNINTEGLGALLIPDFPMGIQESFVEKLQAIEHQRLVQKACCEELDALFASLQDRAFTGKL